MSTLLTERSDVSNKCDPSTSSGYLVPSGAEGRIYPSDATNRSIRRICEFAMTKEDML